jgi:hypothetical protein
MFNKQEQREIDRLRKSGRVIENKQSGYPFRFTVRPFSTVDVPMGKMAIWFEEGVFSEFTNITFCSPISGVAVFPTIINPSIAPSPPDSVRFIKRDNSVSVGINIDFSLWQRSSELERLGLLADNIRCSLDKIKSRYLVDADREKLHHIVDTVQAQLGFRCHRT